MTLLALVHAYANSSQSPSELMNLHSMGALIALAGIAAGVDFWIRLVLFKRSRAAAVIARAAHIPVFARTLPKLLSEELNRARRYQHSVTLAILAPAIEEPMLTAEQTAAVSSHPVLGCALRAAVRENDFVTYDCAKDYYVLLLLEVRQAQSQACVRRIEEFVLQRTGIRLAVGTATFPDEAINLEDLLELTNQKLGPRTELADIPVLPPTLARKPNQSIGVTTAKVS